MQDKNTYEIINSDELGINEDNVVIGIHSGKHAILDKIKKLGVDINEDDIDQVVQETKNHMSITKTITDDKIKRIASNYQIKTKILTNNTVKNQ